ncbi:hypothetical protein BSG1_00580 [Bacillus sp. SG-1]|nr:hypothetical protein BSG1_00580 [Bacillus sp. SG-1]
MKLPTSLWLKILLKKGFFLNFVANYYKFQNNIVIIHRTKTAK